MFTSCQVAIFARLVSSSKTTKKIQKISLNFLFIGLYYWNVASSLHGCHSIIAAWFIHLMSEFHGPKCREMHFPAFSFQKFYGGACPDPPRGDGLKPIVWVLRTHNRLLCKKLRLLKTLKKTLSLIVTKMSLRSPWDKFQLGFCIYTFLQQPRGTGIGFNWQLALEDEENMSRVSVSEKGEKCVSFVWGDGIEAVGRGIEKFAISSLVTAILR